MKMKKVMLTEHGSLPQKDNDGKLYGIYFFEANEYSEGQTDVFELVKVDGLASGNEYLAVAVSKTAGVAWPEGYTKDPEGKTVDAKISNTMNMTLLQKTAKPSIGVRIRLNILLKAE